MKTGTYYTVFPEIVFISCRSGNPSGIHISVFFIKEVSLAVYRLPGSQHSSLCVKTVFFPIDRKDTGFGCTGFSKIVFTAGRRLIPSFYQLSFFVIKIPVISFFNKTCCFCCRLNCNCRRLYEPPGTYNCDKNTDHSKQIPSLFHGGCLSFSDNTIQLETLHN